MRKLPFILQLGIYFCLFLSACDVINPEEEAPVYFQINTPSVEVDPRSGFVAEAGVKDVWVYRGQEFLGAYRAPSVIPILPSEFTSYFFAGGVFQSGLGNQRVQYPFWEATFQNISAQPLDTVALDLVFEYLPLDTAITFPFEETFEGFLKLTKTPGTFVDINRSGENPFQGNACGKVVITTDDTEFEAVSISPFRLPQSGGNDIYAEITYRNDFFFTVGLYYGGSSIGSISDGILYNSNMEWKTVYVHLNNQVRGIAGDVEFRLFIRAINDRNTSGTIYLDNVRLVHLQ